MSILVFIGSILSGGGSKPFEKANSADWADMVDGFQKAALDSRLGIPLFYGSDAVHGNNNVYGATVFPHNIGLGATRFLLFLCRFAFTDYIFACLRIFLDLLIAYYIVTSAGDLKCESLNFPQGHI